MWKAKQYHLPTAFSFYFKDLPADLQQYLLGLIDQPAIGEPVLFFTKPTKEWTMICTRQIICNNNQTIFSIDITNIHSLHPTVLATSFRSPLEGYKKGNHDKRTWHELIVVDKQKHQYLIHASAGPDLFALWNILLMAIRLSPD